MDDHGSAPQGDWVDTPPPAPPAPAGQAPQASPTPAPAPASGFDAQAYLATLPADERAAKASLPAEILEAESKRQMLRADYDRKRGTESEMLRTLKTQNELLAAQNQQMLGMVQGAQSGNGQAQPTLEEVGQKLYEADNPGDYAAGVAQIVERVVGQAVGQAIESNPAIRQLQAGLALRQGRSSVEGATAGDHAEAERAMAAALASKGATIDQLDREVLEVFYPPFLEAQVARRAVAERQQAGPTPTPPAPQPGRRTLPVSGSGISGGVPVKGEDGGPYGPKSTLQGRINATLKGLNLTPQQLAEMAATF